MMSLIKMVLKIGREKNVLAGKNGIGEKDAAKNGGLTKNFFGGKRRKMNAMKNDDKKCVRQKWAMLVKMTL